MLEPLSATHKAFRDTTISRSSKEWFGIVSRQWGIPHLKYFVENQWRQVVRSNAMGPRGSFGAAHEFLYWAFKHLATTVTVQVSSSAPTTLTAAPGTFIQNNVNCLVRSPDGVVWKIVGPDDIGNGSQVVLSSISNLPYYVRANFTESATFDVEILPFIVWESPGKLHVDIWSATVPFSPATYLQPGAASPASPTPVSQSSGSQAETYNGGAVQPAPDALPLIGADDRPAGQPYGGHIQENEFEPGGTGPHPIYLSEGGAFDEIESILDTLLVAGVKCVIRRRIDILE
jgi:hypothetical protein